MSIEKDTTLLLENLQVGKILSMDSKSIKKFQKMVLLLNKNEFF